MYMYNTINGRVLDTLILIRTKLRFCQQNQEHNEISQRVIKRGLDIAFITASEITTIV